MKIIPLGVNGHAPSHGRQTMSFLLLTDTEALIIDAGTGMCRLFEEKIASLLKGYDFLNIVLSHYHSDHVAGLFYLPDCWPKEPIQIYAPRQPLVDCSNFKGLNRLLAPPYCEITFADNPDVKFQPVNSDSLQIGPHLINLRRQQHAGGSVGMRFGDSFAYITDTPVDEETVDFVKDVDLLIHEVWLTDKQAEAKPEEVEHHSFVSGVAGIAVRAGVKRLLPVHINPTQTWCGIADIVSSLSEKCGSGIEVLTPVETKPIEL